MLDFVSMCPGCISNSFVTTLTVLHIMTWQSAQKNYKGLEIYAYVIDANLIEKILIGCRSIPHHLN